MDFRESVIAILIVNFINPVPVSLSNDYEDSMTYCLRDYRTQDQELEWPFYCKKGFTPVLISNMTVARDECFSLLTNGIQQWCFSSSQLKIKKCQGNFCTLAVKPYRASALRICNNTLLVHYKCIPSTEPTESEETGHKSASGFMITIVILGIFILGAVVFVAVYIYRNPGAKLNEYIRVSRGLRHRPSVERNIYSAPHTGMSAAELEFDDLPPPSYPAPSLQDALRTVDRSITGMRLPAIPPRRIGNLIPGHAPNALDNSEPFPTQSQSPKLNKTMNNVHDVELPIAITSYPSSVESDSDSDTSESGDENMLKQMLNMNRDDDQDGQPKNVIDIEKSSHPIKTNETSQQLQYVAVVTEEDGSDEAGNKDEEDICKGAEDGPVIVYSEIDKEKTLSLSKMNQARTKRDSGDF